MTNTQTMQPARTAFTAWSEMAELLRDAGVEPPECPDNPYVAWSQLRNISRKHRHVLRPVNAIQAVECGMDQDGQPFQPRKGKRPSATLVGSLDRVAAYAARLAAGEELFHPEDGLGDR